jgi:hypothetical protein
LHSYANPPFLRGFLFSGLPCVALYCVPSGVRVVSNILRASNSGCPAPSADVVLLDCDSMEIEGVCARDRRMVTSGNPIVRGNSSEQERFKEVQQAYKVLSNPDKKRHNDEKLRASSSRASSGKPRARTGGRAGGETAPEANLSDLLNKLADHSYRRWSARGYGLGFACGGRPRDDRAADRGGVAHAAGPAGEDRGGRMRSFI